MSTTSTLIVVAAVLLVGGSAAARFVLPSKRMTSNQPAEAPSCSPATFAELLRLREQDLREESRSELPTESAEGSSVTVYYEGSIPRIVKLIDLGETGRAETSFFLLDTLNFVAWRREYRYRSPISPDQSVQIAETQHAIQVVCDGVPLGAIDSADSADLTDRLRMALR